MSGARNRFELRDVGMNYGAATVLRGVTFSLGAEGLTAIVGPNGAGKSTLLGILAGLRGGYSGECRYSGTEVRAWKRREMARRVAFVPQSVRIDFPFTAEQIVMMGRAPHAGSMFEGDDDRRIGLDAMEMTATSARSAAANGSA